MDRGSPAFTVELRLDFLDADNRLLPELASPRFRDARATRRRCDRDRGAERRVPRKRDLLDDRSAGYRRPV